MNTVHSKKKMPTTQNFSNKVLNYYPAYLSEGKIWYVTYYVYNPFTERMQLKRIKINRIKSITERRKYARILIQQINKKLENGWNPIIEKDSVKEYHYIVDAIETYRRSKFPDLESNSIRSYKSFLERLIKHIVSKDEKMYCGSFDKRIASDFMLKIKQTVGVRTYNNYLLFYKQLFEWLKEYAYVTDNPFSTIHILSKKHLKKNRNILTRSQLKELFEYLDKTSPRYMVACMLIYYCCLRPSDLSCLTPKNFDIKRKLIFISGEETKNDKDSYRVIPHAIDKYIDILELEETPANYYIFSDSGGKYDFLAGSKKIDSRKFAKYWDTRVRKALSWGLSLKLYSLKDSGITYLMEDGISPAYVQGQADHSTLETTNKYVHTQTPESFEQIRALAKSLF